MGLDGLDSMENALESDSRGELAVCSRSLSTTFWCLLCSLRIVRRTAEAAFMFIGLVMETFYILLLLLLTYPLLHASAVPEMSVKKTHATVNVGVSAINAFGRTFNYVWIIFRPFIPVVQLRGVRDGDGAGDCFQLHHDAGERHDARASSGHRRGVVRGDDVDDRDRAAEADAHSRRHIFGDIQPLFAGDRVHFDSSKGRGDGQHKDSGLLDE